MTRARLSQYVVRRLTRKMFILVRFVCHRFIINLGIADHEDISKATYDDTIQDMEIGEPAATADNSALFLVL